MTKLEELIKDITDLINASERDFPQPPKKPGNYTEKEVKFHMYGFERGMLEAHKLILIYLERLKEDAQGKIQEVKKEV